MHCVVGLSSRVGGLLIFTRYPLQNGFLAFAAALAYQVSAERLSVWFPSLRHHVYTYIYSWVHNYVSVILRMYDMSQNPITIKK